MLNHKGSVFADFHVLLPYDAEKVGLILLMQMSGLCVCQTSLDTTTMLNSITVTYNENPAIVIIKEASKTCKEYKSITPKTSGFTARSITKD